MALTETQIREFKSFAERLAEAARSQTLPRFRAGTDVFNKAGIWYDPVTDADREAERAMRRLINAAFPDHGILGEEFGEEAPAAPMRWVLDPVDGTSAFICGVPSWTTLIALENDNKPVLGLIDQGFTKERWIGDNDVTLFSDGAQSTPCQTSDVKDLARARISTTDPRPAVYFTSQEAAGFNQIAEQARLVRFGFDAYAYALLAMGELDLIVEAGLKHHDYAALAPVVRGAGGIISDWKSGDFDANDRGRVVAAATPELHEAAIDLLMKIG